MSPAYLYHHTRMFPSWKKIIVKSQQSLMACHRFDENISYFPSLFQSYYTQVVQVVCSITKLTRNEYLYLLYSIPCYSLERKLHGTMHFTIKKNSIDVFLSNENVNCIISAYASASDQGSTKMKFMV